MSVDSQNFILLPYHVSTKQSKKTKAYTKLTYNLEGIKKMIQTPSALFVVDTQKDQLAIKEAKKLDRKVFNQWFRLIPNLKRFILDLDPNNFNNPILFISGQEDFLFSN